MDDFDFFEPREMTVTLTLEQVYELRSAMFDMREKCRENGGNERRAERLWTIREAFDHVVEKDMTAWRNANDRGL